MKQYILILTLSTFYINGFSQTESQEKYIKKELGVKQIVWDQENQDGIFKALNKKTNKWGMFQYFEGRRPKRLVSFKYDSLGFYKFNASFTIVKNNGKYGLISDPWGEPKAKLIVKCKHDQLRYVKNGYGMLASKRGKNWAYINEQGDTLIPYASKTFEDLPIPNRQFLKHPMPNYPQKLLDILANPSKVEHIDLKGLALPYIPDEISLCVNAKTATLENNKLTELPESFFKLTQLEKLFLGGNPSLNKFGANYGKLINLKVLYIGANAGYGHGWNSRTQKTFHKEMSNLKKLKILVLDGTIMDAGDIPSFIYQLPQLTTLTLSGGIGRSFKNVHFEKMECKSKLEIMDVGVMDVLDNWNTSMQYFPKLRTVRLSIYGTKTPPIGLYDIVNLKSMKATYFVKIENGSYNGAYILRLNKTDQTGKINATNRKKAIQKWETYLKK